MGAFLKNRHEVVSRCIEVGINLIDFAGDAEPETYCKVLEGRRDKMYLAYSHPASELRVPENRTAKKLLELFEAGLKRCKLEYADIWRLMALERGGDAQPGRRRGDDRGPGSGQEEGLCRFTGISTHDRDWAKKLIENVSRRDAGALHALHGQVEGAARRTASSTRSRNTTWACWASSRSPATRSSRATARPTARMPRKTTAGPGWRSATSSATRRSPRRFPG